jgi:CubicO group peptidase (beta-lactamase class C family)
VLTLGVIIFQLFDVVATGLLIHNETLSPRLTWKSKLASVIPGFGLEDSVAFQQTTIIDAMSHRTGLPRHDASYRLSDNVTSVVSTLAIVTPLRWYQRLIPSRLPK